MIPANLPDEHDASFEAELMLLLRGIGLGRRIRDLRESLRSAKESMCCHLPTAFEPREETTYL
jgi:hypothetical protein